MARPMNQKVEKPKNTKKAIKNLFTALKDMRLQIILSLFFATISTVLAILGPDLIRKIGTLILSKPINLNKIHNIGIGLIIIYVSSFVLGFLKDYILGRVAIKTAKKFRSQIAGKINNLPLKYLDCTPTGDILSRVTNDVDMVTDTMQSSLSTVITTITTIIGSIVMMLIYSWKLTLIAVILIPISFIVISLIFKASQKYFQQQQASIGEINGHIEEVYSGHTVVTAYSAEDDVLNKFDEINNRLYRASFKGNVLSGLTHPIMMFFTNIGYALIIIIGGSMAMTNITFAPVVMAFAIYYRRFNNQITQIASIIGNMQMTLAAGERIFDFLEIPDQEDESNKKLVIKDVKGEVELSHVNFGYTPDKQILYDLNVKIKPGQKVAIVGSTGAGKTTLVNLLMRFYEVDSGDILIDGVKITDMKRENVRKLFGMVLQDTWLFEGTIKENIGYGMKGVNESKIVEVCERAGIDHIIRSQPNGYDMILTEESNFSAGEKQLLTIARAMLQDSPMLILDEATSSVDTRTEIIIQEAMDKLLKNRTSFIIAHRLSTIVNADLILVMQNGRIVESGTHQELLEKNGVYAGLYNAQF